MPNTRTRSRSRASAGVSRTTTPPVVVVAAVVVRARSCPRTFQYTSRLTSASPKLLVACATGEHIKKAVLTGRRAGKTQFEFLSITFADVLVSAYDTSAVSGEEGVPAAQVSLNFASLRMTYKTQKADGSVGQTIVGGFDFKANKKI
jgi:type VI secretion system secreted protein Hcp